MKALPFLILLLLTIGAISQNKPIVYFNENGEKISEKEFLNAKDYSRNLDLYFENETTKTGLLIPRQKFGHLDKETFSNLKLYLTQISGKQIDSTDNIVINYLTYRPEEENDSRPISKYSVLYKDYLKGLHKTANINQFWIGSGQSDLSYLEKYKVDYILDKEGIFKILFFPYEVKYGNYIFIKPDGNFYYYMGEHSKNHIWEKSEKFFK